MGEHREFQPVTLADMKSIFTSIEEVITTRVTSAISNILRDDSRFSDILNIIQAQLVTNGAGNLKSITRQGEHNPDLLRAAHIAPLEPATASPLPGHDTGLPPGLYVPNIPHSTPPEERWKAYIQQWDLGDGRCVALKDWEPCWTKHPAFANKYHQRKLVALEFER